MTEPTPEAFAALEERLMVLQATVYTMHTWLSRTSHTADQTAAGLDDIEELVREVARGQTTAEPTAATTPGPQGETVPSPHASTVQPSTSTSADTETSTKLPEADSSEAPEIDLSDLTRWVHAHLGHIQRKITATGEGTGIRWCAQWWKHPDAVTYLTAIRMAYAALSTSDDHTWLSVYLRDHRDMHLDRLTSPSGPFHACTPHHHVDSSPLPLQQPEHSAHDPPPPAEHSRDQTAPR